jgi:hypothetical protein
MYIDESSFFMQLRTVYKDNLNVNILFYFTRNIKIIS